MSIIPLPIEKLKLQRFPKSKDISLKAWNAADEYLIDWLADNPLQSTDNILIINDQFGSLTCSLAHYHPFYWTDSYLSKTAIQMNIEENNLSSTISHINQCSHLIPDGIKFDLVIIRIPKHNSLLNFQLRCILPNIHEATTVISAGMTKEIHKSNLNLFETIIGPTKTSLAKKKARMIFCEYRKNNNNQASDAILKQASVSYKIEQNNLTSIGLPGVFSRDSLDIGSRVLLKYMPETKAGQKLIDLGCGTGILGTYAAKQNPELEVTFTDESWLAVESAKQTFKENIRTTDSDSQNKVSFRVANVLDGLDNNHYDHVLCNPPFHQQNVQTLAIANKMFNDSGLKLNSDGELRVVANRHLKYRSSLEQYFSQVEVISKDPKFVVWLARKSKK